MRIYFLSEHTAALKLNGAYMGLIDGFEKFAEINLSDNVLAEAVPDGDAQPVHFFINEVLLTRPPECCDVYLTDGDAVVFISRYPPKHREVKVLAQTEFNGNTVTLFSDGGIYLHVNGAVNSLYPLSAAFENAEFTPATVGGYPLLIVSGKGAVCALSAEGKRVFYNPAESWQCGDTLDITVAFNTCTGCKAVCSFAYDGAKMTVCKSRTEESRVPDDSVMHFAFFESVLTRADYARYLCDGLKGNADALPQFLGEFVDVTIPHSKFFERHGDIRAAGLVYPLSVNLFDVKFFAVDMEDGKITNVYPVS